MNSEKDLSHTRQVILPFALDPPEQSVMYGSTYRRSSTTQVDVPFLPLGLLFWGATKDTFVSSVRSGNMAEVGAAHRPIPARYFEARKTFAELIALAEKGELPKHIADNQILEMHEISPGCMMSVETIGPYESFCVWGTTYRAEQPRQLACISKSGDRFNGVISDRTLRGTRPLFTVETPSEDSCSELLSSFMRKQHHRGY
jgi:hypothetical protein